jgi:two-component system, LytTR family, response regulator
MKALIVDDEPIARQILREYLGDVADVEIVGEAGSGSEAVRMISSKAPDLVFLDLQMPELGGIEVARGLRGSSTPLTIFVTAYENRALDAFDAGAVDYLLKPIRKERLEAALVKARTQLAGMKPRAEAARKIVGRMGNRTHLLAPEEVIAFQADGELVFILTAHGKYFANQSLRALESKLDASRFRRIHRKTIINVDHVRKISPLSSKRWLLSMSNGLEVVVSKRMAGLVRVETRR